MITGLVFSRKLAVFQHENNETLFLNLFFEKWEKKFDLPKETQKKTFINLSESLILNNWSSFTF